MEAGEGESPDECWLVKSEIHLRVTEKRSLQSPHYHQIPTHKAKFVLIYLAFQSERHEDRCSTSGFLGNGYSKERIRYPKELLCV